jgi:hypothetical protein
MHHGLVFSLRGVGSWGRDLLIGDGGDGLERFDSERLLKLLDDAADLSLSPSVSSGVVGVFVNVHIGHDGEAAGAVIKDEDDIGDKKHHVGETKFIWGRFGQGGLEEADHVIGQIANRTAMKNWESRMGRRLVGAHQVFEDLKWVASDGELAFLTSFIDLDFAAAGGDEGAWSGAEKGVATGVLGELGGLKKKAALAVADFLISREWRLVVSGDLSPDGDQISMGGKFLEGREGGLEMEV